MATAQNPTWSTTIENEVIKDYNWIDPKDPERKRIRKQMWACDLVLYKGEALPENRVYTIRAIRQQRGHFYPASIRSGFRWWPSGIFSLPLYQALVSAIRHSETFAKAQAMGIVDPIEAVDSHPRYMDMLTGQHTDVRLSRKTKERQETE